MITIDGRGEPCEPDEHGKAMMRAAELVRAGVSPSVASSIATHGAEPMRPSLAFGLRATPEGLPAVWGARLIWPNDLVHDRQDLSAADDESKAALMAWLNGGALRAALSAAGELAGAWELSPREDREVTLYEDQSGIVKANPQGSHGYLYVAGWLK